MDQRDGPFDATLTNSWIHLDPPEWLDCDSEFTEAIESFGKDTLTGSSLSEWTWHHDYIFTLPESERAVLVSFCEHHEGRILTWQEAARMLHSVLGDPPDLQETTGVEYEQDYGYDGDVFDYEPYDDEEYYDEGDPSDSEMDMGYREDYDEDDEY